MKKYDYQDAIPEVRGQMIDEIAGQYNLRDKAQTVQALAHCQAQLGAVQTEFTDLSSVVSVTARSIRNWKKEHEELYQETFNKFTPEPELADVDGDIEEDALESVYQNLLSRLQSSKTSTKDLAQILQYFGISGQELRQYATNRGKSLRGFYRDNEKALVEDEDNQKLIQSIFAESGFLYLGTPKSQGNTDNYMSMNLDEPLVRLELMTAGALMYGLWNGQLSPQTIEMMQTLRVLKMADGQDIKEDNYKEFEQMDGNPKPLKPVTKKLHQDLLDIFGLERGQEMYLDLLNTKQDVDEKTKVKLPDYETVKHDYDRTLKVFPNRKDMHLDVMLSKLDAHADQDTTKEKYKNYLEDEDNE